MGRRAGKETIKVHDGVYLRRVGDSYHCYFRLDGKQFRRSTKTRDLAAAKLKALSWFRDANARSERGEQIESVSFARLKRSYLEHIRGHGKHSYHAATIERHFLPFFSKFDDVSKLRRSDILDYLKFRRAKGISSASPQTINRENTVLRQMLRYSVDRGWLKSAPHIDNESEKLTRRRRRHFSIEEYRTLHRVGRKRSRELEGIELRTRQDWQRKLLYDVVLLLANTGMRVDELKTLVWRNIDWKDGSILLEHAGKTKSTRRVLMRKSAVDALGRIRDRRLAFLARSGTAMDFQERVISLPNGKAVGSLKKGFDQLLVACGFKYATAAEKHALTSLRHTYATLRLTTKSGKRASVRALAKQMGTSERMIERHYGHDVVDDYRDELAG